MMPDLCATSPPAPPRSRPSPQSLVALASLACLLAIAGGLLAVQSRMNPAVANFLAISAGGPGTGPAALSADEPPLVPFPEGMTALTPVERFTPETLSDKINGKAELYLSAGVLGLACQRVGLAGQPGVWVEAFVFDMGSGENAFAVFSVQRRPEAEPLDLAEFAYRAGNALFFVHGAAYVELIGSEESAAVVAALAALARGLIGSAPAPAAAAMAERDLFPGEGLVAESIRLIPADAFGLAGFDRVYTAAYTLGPVEMTAFLARRSSAAAAAEAAAAYAGFLTTYGGTVLSTDQPVAGAAIISIMDAVEVVFAKGDFVAGVHEAPDPEQAVALARRVASQLSEVPSAR
jgi:hypothetical protein